VSAAGAHFFGHFSLSMAIPRLPSSHSLDDIVSREIRPDSSARKSGFFEHKQYQKIRRYLPADLQVAITIAYTFGWRMQSEVLTLERRQLDLKLGALRLEPDTTKNNEGRLVYLTPELRSLMTAQVNRVAALERQTRMIIRSCSLI